MNNHKFTISKIMKNIPLKLKVLPAIAIVFLTAMSFVSIYSAQKQKAAIVETAKTQANDILSSYLDSLNAMMLTGTIGTRKILDDKLIIRDNVNLVRMMRSKKLQSVFGAGFEHQKAQDDLDEKGLSGDLQVNVKETDQGRVLIVVKPHFNTKNHHGTNCTICHTNFDIGDVIGASRIELSLANKDDEVSSNIWEMFAINAVIFIIGLLMLNYLFGKVVITPLTVLDDTLSKIKDTNDLTVRVNMHCNDEFNSVAEVVNGLLEHFQSIILQLNSSTERLKLSSNSLQGVTDKSTNNMKIQSQQTDQLTQAMQDILSSSGRVAQSANQAQNAAQEAQDQANSGRSIVQGVSQSITDLSQKVDSASAVVQNLASDSESVEQVLTGISQIAEQTNLLALNAAIEAARAGEQGRGFAVVADEVRTLASRTQVATQEIKETINSLRASSQDAVSVMTEGRKKADDSVEEAEKGVQSLSSILSAVNGITELNRQIAEDVNSQNETTKMANQQLSSITQISHETIQGANETAQSAADVGKIANDLNDSIHRFKV